MWKVQDAYDLHRLAGFRDRSRNPYLRSDVFLTECYLYVSKYELF